MCFATYACVTLLKVVTFLQNEQPEGELAMDPVIKHPLENCWAIWFFKNDKAKEWSANLKRIAAFDTVEDFWA